MTVLELAQGLHSVRHSINGDEGKVMKAASWKFALLVMVASFSLPVLAQSPVECAPGQAELEGITAQPAVSQRDTGMTLDEALLQKRKKAREEDLARLKARYVNAAARSESRDQYAAR